MYNYFVKRKKATVVWSSMVGFKIAHKYNIALFKCTTIICIFPLSVQDEVYMDRPYVCNGLLWYVWDGDLDSDFQHSSMQQYISGMSSECTFPGVFILKPNSKMLEKIL